MEKIGLYIHVPFCNSKCTYCDFTSFVPKASERNQIIDQYFDALHTEFNQYIQNGYKFSVESIYFGGGTPSSVPASHIETMLTLIKSKCTLTDDCEITLEVNPGTITRESAIQYKNSGINRISMGLQTTSNSLLKTIGRTHDFETFQASYKLLRDIGFDNISLDLMFGLPGQSMASLRESMQEIIRLNPEHASIYSLKVESGTPMAKMLEKGLIKLPDEDMEREMYHTIIDVMESYGFYQYEISNFSKPGMASKHNLIYWHNQPYLGLGLSAHSKLNSVRFANTNDFETYLSIIGHKNRSIRVEETKIDTLEDLFETIILGLRLNEGLDIEKLNQAYQIDFEQKYHSVLEKLKLYELIETEGQVVKLTQKGMDLSNQVFGAFMNE